MSDPNRKSMRQFQCRDVLWDTFEQLARELECSVDYLINEAMKQYARQRSAAGRSAPPPNRSDGRGADMAPTGAPTFTSPTRSSALPPPPALPPGSRGGLGPPAGRSSGLPPSAPPPARSLNVPTPPPRSAGLGSAGVAPPGASARGGAGGARGVPPPMPRGGGPPPLGAGSLGGPTPPPLPPDARGAEPRFSEASRGGDAGRFADGNRNGYGQTGLGSLAIVYQGERYVVNKDRFVIGRGKQSSDLTLKDPNVSRQHAMVEYQNGVYFIVDMGSTNGVEYNGQRIARKQVAEGDVFRICDHDLFFTYR